MRDQDRRNIALVLFGVIPGFIPLVITQPLCTAIAAPLIMGIAMLLCLLVGVGVLQNQYHSFVIRKRTRQPFRIGLLSDVGEFVAGADYYVCTDVGLESWKSALAKGAQSAKAKVKIKLIKITDKFDGYSAMVNPYGGAYPEADLSKLSTLSRILHYVREGGLFVNVADIPIVAAGLAF